MIGLKEFIIAAVLVVPFISAVGFSVYEEQRFSEKCEEAGMLAVRSWQGDLYCVKGFRDEIELNFNEDE